MDLTWGQRRFIEIDGVDVHVEAAGPDDDAARPVLALLHGFASGTFTWAGVAPAWARTHRVVAWDRPPFGRSGRPVPVAGSSDPYRLTADLERSRAVLETTVGAAGVVLVGHSAGALHAAQLALARGLPLRGLVLIAPALDGEPPALVRRLAGMPGAGAVGAAVIRVAGLGAEAALKAVGVHRTPLTDATAKDAGRCLRRPGTGAALMHVTATWRPPHALDLLDALDVPSLVIGGADDRMCSPTSTATVAHRLGAELYVLDDVGHAAHEQAPGVVADIVAGFLESVEKT